MQSIFKFFGVFFLVAILASCQTTSKKEASHQITLSDLTAVTALEVGNKGEFTEHRPLDLSPLKGKVVIVRVIGTWCPYCKNDLVELYKRFLNTGARSQVEVVFITTATKRETVETVSGFRKFVADKWRFDATQFRLWYVDADPKDSTVNGFRKVAAVQAKDGSLLFPGIEGVPYGMVFDKKGDLRIRGHFTESKDEEEKHYQAIAAILKE